MGYITGRMKRKLSQFKLSACPMSYILGVRGFSCAVSGFGSAED